MLIVDGLQRLHLRASLKLRDGECIAVQGASGSGKTLLLRALADLDPAEGGVTLNGQSRELIPAPVWRRRVCYVPAEPGWWGELVEDHFRNWARAHLYVQQLDFPPDCRSWPITRLSTGERQRLALVRAIVLDPEVLLLDEPTAALDPASTRRVEHLVAKKQEIGTSVIWVTHDLDQVKRVASRLLVLENGNLREAP